MGFSGGGGILEQKPGYSRDFWSDTDDIVSITAAATDTALPDVVVAGLDTDITLERVVLLLKVRKIANSSSTGANALSGAQVIEVKENSEAWAVGITAINLTDNMWTVPTLTEDAGDVIVGDNDIKATVDGNGTYNVQIASALADYANLNLSDLQVGVRCYWKI